ncbi:binding-protein-dependent transport system inner membrane component [Paenibacillus mucilaginosus 3016]|uniref:Binding-protein-dependent transport system inner membrane component n=2 Tax=Paenibacillus mucilaginosus TaxID=61624 RepID=H6NPX8_9BACL|nr:ABC transporter permease subunit [Paenibacillus mucilaginosus]AFC31169.1 binding-protein-dependent transport system inner membrane component [Paenibacillus mucilaginosus 3016]AFH63490.1 protein lplB [Paenibacillus mucilaginosus K02]WFA19745.1 sugar ABC transporter permease [Paenibacillus mucilaginosus]
MRPVAAEVEDPRQRVRGGERESFPPPGAGGDRLRSRVRSGRWRSNLRRSSGLYLLALPGVLFFLLFKYVPMWGVLIAFQNYSPYTGMLDSPWVGLDHFRRFFSNPDFLLLFRNTLGINLLSLIFFFPLPLLLSLLLNEVRHTAYKRLVQSVIYMPHFLSWVIIAGLTFLLFGKAEGLVNLLLEAAGRPKLDVLTNPDTFWLMITLQSMWKEAGWGTIIFLAAMAGADPQVYEAARMDGAGRFRQMWHVTLPAIRSVFVILLILRLGDIMDVGFEQIFLMYNGAVSHVAEVFDTYVYRTGIQQGEFSYSTAAGLFKSLVGLVLVLLANRAAKKFGEDGVF